MAIRLCSVRVGEPQHFLEPEPWTTAFFKEAVVGPVSLSRLNLAGDRQADLSVHGGTDKAVCVYSNEHYAVQVGSAKTSRLRACRRLQRVLVTCTQSGPPSSRFLSRAGRAGNWRDGGIGWICRGASCVRIEPAGISG